MFLDIDHDGEKTEESSSGLLSRLFGKHSKPAEPPRSHERMLVQKLESWLSNHRDWHCRLYRTRAGFRVLVTHALFNPEIVAGNGVFAALGVDPLYQRLCKAQNCFRARLTPKPWRCNAGLPPARWPWENERAQVRFQRWAERYKEKCRALATCSFLGDFGSGTTHAELEPLIAHHDGATRAHSQLPLA
jgi:hypothetical protein